MFRFFLWVRPLLRLSHKHFHCSSKNRTSPSFQSHSQLDVATSGFSVPSDLPVLDAFYCWSHTICGHLWRFLSHAISSQGLLTSYHGVHILLMAIWICHNSLISSLADMYLACSQFSAIMNDVSINFCIQGSVYFTHFHLSSMHI